MGSDSAGGSGAFDLAAWFAWFGELDRALAFLLVLPLVVAAVGLWAHLREREEEREGDGDGAPRAGGDRVGRRDEVREG